MTSIAHLVHIDSTAPEGAAAQIHTQVAAAIERGALTPGEHLPPVRALASELGVAANTAAKAIRSLEAAGIVSTHGRHGTRVESLDAAVREAQEAAACFAKATATAGISREDAHRMLDAALDSAPTHQTRHH